MTARHLGHEVGGCGRNHDEIGLAGKADVADLAFLVEVEQIDEHAVAGECADRQWRHELGRSLGHDGANGVSALARPTDQVQAFVSGDAAADDQQNAFGGHGVGFRAA